MGFEVAVMSSGYHRGICLEDLRNTKKISVMMSGVLAQDINPRHPPIKILWSIQIKNKLLLLAALSPEYLRQIHRSS
jgi:hypothetical protein